MRYIIKIKQRLIKLKKLIIVWCSDQRAGIFEQEGGEGADHTLEMWDMGEMGEYHLKTGG